ncbi:hypothetical protein [Absidia glauca]|uniref:Uncharacterized protein n=1 Tax=Absidia glauca TaxID=4829 RepID=A0A163J3Z4_ABSGL|nr:hypothetical protein [Absidia glauca]
MEPDAERYEDTAFRVLMESGVKAHNLSRRIAVYTDANKKGKIIGHHAMYECTSFTLMPAPANLDRSRVWYRSASLQEVSNITKEGGYHILGVNARAMPMRCQ